MNDTVTPAIDAAATAVVTGASSGIGRELALQLAPRVGRLILVARRRTQLEELARQCERPGLQVGIRSCDLGDREERGQFARSLTEESVDLLVCAAGFGADGHFDEIEVEQMEEMLEVNLLAAMHLTRAVLPGMLQRNRGTLVMVGSGAGVWPVPRSTTYCTTKAGLHGFCEALRLDLTGTGVHVTEALPGPVETEFDAVAGTEGGMDTPAAAMRIGAE